MTTIYGLTDPATGEVRYIGKSNNPEKRLKNHLRDRRKSHRVSWLKSLTRSGLRPGLVILEKVDDADWQEAERRWIKHFQEQGADLTNSTDGGDGLDNPSEETRKKMSEKAKKRRYSAEVCKRMSEARKGKPSGMKGHEHSEETRLKISAAKKGQPSSRKGSKHSKASILKMSEAAQGREVSKETREKLSAATRAYIQTPEGADVLAKAQAMAQTPEACANKSIAHKARAQTDDGKAQLAKMLVASHTPKAQAKRSAALKGNQNAKGRSCSKRNSKNPKCKEATYAQLV